ncbi:ABC transporter ATP-binding protein [Corynebacterium sp. 335C]
MTAAAAPELDALRPEPPRGVARVLGSLPSAPSRGWWAAFGLVSAAMAGSGIVATRASGAIVDALGDGARVAWLAGLVAACLVLQQAAGAGVSWIAGQRIRRLAVELRRRGAEAVLRAPVPRVQELGTGNVVTRLTTDIDHAVNVISMILVRLVSAILLLPFTLVALALLGWWYALAIAVAVPVLAVLARAVARAMPPAVDRLSSASAHRNNVLLDVLRGLPTLRAFGLGGWGRARARAASWRAVRANAGVQPVIDRSIAYIYVFYTALLCAIVVLGTVLSARGAVTLGVAVSAVVYVSRLEMAVFDVMEFASEVQKAMTCLGRACALARLDGGGARDLPEPEDLGGPAEVRVEGLRFSYPGTAGRIFDGLDLRLAAGEVTALVGTSGAGKSTLAGLVAGLYVPDGGRILVGGRDVAGVPDSWTARQVTLLGQETHLFSGTLREDLLLAAGDGAGDAELEAALAVVGLAPGSAGRQRHLPDGLDTRIGAGAADVGPAVAQQIALARIVLRDPPVLIMDEATAEAGSEDADELTAAATRIARGRTSLVVAHRLDQAEAADRVLVMDGGRIAEDGAHADLLAAGGRYRALWDAWNRRGTAT